MTMREKINLLNYHTELYDQDKAIWSDKEWDEMYFALKKEEEETGIIYPNSPTQKIHYEVVSELKKIKHNHPMLSLDKTKDFNDIKNFIKGHSWIAMAKLDGLTCSLKYLNGKLISAETRGNGIEGEDITHNAKIISSIPQEINYKKELVIDGEIICTYKNFENFNTEYKNPRNFASGSIRLLNSKECAKRELTFIAWDVIKGFDKETLTENLIELRQIGFTVVPLTIKNLITPDINSAINFLKEHCELKSYPIDGIVFKYDNIKEYGAAGRTDHHFKGGLAYKFYDELYPTRLKTIRWTMGRTGVLTPAAVFDPIDIDGTVVERASLHNVSMMREMLGDCAYVGEPLKIFKANQIIPQIAEAGPKLDYGTVIAHGGVSAHDVIEKCPICGKDIIYKTSNDGIVNVYCENPNCEGKLINRLNHFFGKKGLNIKGLSKATFEKLINWEWISSITDVFNLNNYKEEWIKKPSFGEKSVSKTLKAIEEGKNTTLEAFISAIGIPLIGQAAAKDLAKEFKTYENFKKAVLDDSYSFDVLNNFGYEMNESIKNYDYKEADTIANLLNFEIIKDNKVNSNTLEKKIIVITGKLNNFKNRSELKKIIEEHGGKVSSSISSKTNILINNDINSTSSKNKQAKEYGIPIISESDFITQYLEK